MNRLLMILILSTHIMSAMDSENSNTESPSIRRAFSDNSALPQRHQLTDSMDNSNDSREFSSAHSLTSESSRLDSDATDDDDNDELSHLAELTEDRSASPFATLRGRHRIKVPRRPHTHEATYDDIARLIQFNSRTALSEARTLNRQYVDAIFTQLQEEAAVMRTQVSAGVTSVSSSLVALDSRLQKVEKLLPLVAKFLETEKALAEKYEATCTQLITAFQEYAQNVGTKELEVIELLKELKSGQKKTNDKLTARDPQFERIESHARETHGIVRLHIFKDTLCRNACAVTTSLGVLALFIWCLTGSHGASVMETNASLHPTV